jgi:hypothetical protein
MTRGIVIHGAGTEPGPPLVVAAARGWALTLGIELLLAADIRSAASDARFAHMEVNRASASLAASRSSCPATPGGATRCGGC